MKTRIWLWMSLWLSLWLWAGAAVTLAADVPDSFAQFREWVLADQGMRWDKRELTIEGLTFEIESGVAWPVLDRLGEISGFAFEGKARYRYRSRDPQDQLVFQHNVEQLANNIEHTDRAIWDDLTRFAAIGRVSELESVWSDSMDQPLSSTIRDYWGKFQEGVRLDQSGPDHYLAEIARNRCGGYLFVQLDGKRGQLGYELDRLRDHAEQLVVFRRESGVERRGWQRVSIQTLAAARERLPLNYSMIEAAFAIDTADNRRGTVVTEMMLRAERDQLRVLAFSLLNQRSTKSARWDFPQNSLHVTRVIDATGRELSFSHRYNQLLIDLGQPLARGASTKLRVETEGDFFTGPDGKRYDDYFDLFFTEWYPQPLPWLAARFRFKLSIATKQPFLPVASGDTVARREDDTRYYLETKSDIPVWTIAVFAGKFQTATYQDGGLTVNVYDYATARDRDLEGLAKKARAFVGIFSNLFGPYPYQELDIVGVNYYSIFGISPATLLILTQPTTQANVTMPFHGVNALIAHEVAHQWFGHRAWPGSRLYDGWLNESFAEYASGLAMGKVLQILDQDPALYLDFKEMLATWRGNADFVKSLGTIRGADLIGGEIGFIQRVNQLYNRGPLVLHMLRTTIGEERFVRVLRDYLERAQNGAMTTTDFSTSLSNVMGADWAWFIDQWVRQPGRPTVSVKHRLERDGAAGWQLVVTASQSDAPIKRLHIPLVLESSDGSKIVKLFELNSAEETRAFALQSKPWKVLVDPARNNLVNYR
jgi:hypothetical protein